MKSTIVLATVASALALAGADAYAQTPKRGGILNIAVGGEPPNADCHQSTSTFALGLSRPVYSQLVRYDMQTFPRIIPDLAESWTIAPDGLTYTFKLFSNVKFHDGSPFSSADIKATFDRIRNPPAGIPSQRQSDFAELASIETPDATTAIFRLSRPNSAMLDLIANPYNCVYSARKLQENQKYPESEAMGTGAFTRAEYVRGSHVEGKRFAGYFRAGLPYIDGYRVAFLAANAAVPAMTAGQIDLINRSLSPQEVELAHSRLGNSVVAETKLATLMAQEVINVKRKPFDDVRVRRALALAVDHRGGLEPISKVSVARAFGGLVRPGSEWAMADAELERLPGYGRDLAAARAEARRLLAEAGQSNLRVRVLSNQATPATAPVLLFMLDQWKSIGADAQQEPTPAAAYESRSNNGDFDLVHNTNSSASDDPTLLLVKYLPGSPSNLGGISDPLLTELFDKQKTTLDRAQRKTYVTAFEQHALNQAYVIPVFWNGQTPAYRTYLRNWVGTSSQIMGFDFTEVWLDK